MLSCEFHSFSGDTTGIVHNSWKIQVFKKAYLYLKYLLQIASPLFT